MKLENFQKAQTSIAISNAVSGIKSNTPLLSGLFKYGKPSKTTTVQLAYDKRTGKVLPAADRASSNTKNAKNTLGEKTRKGIPVNAIHITSFANIESEDIQDIPEIEDSASLESFTTYMSGELSAQADEVEATREYHAMGAINGVVLDEDGATEIHDFYTLFGIQKVELAISQADLAGAGKLIARIDAAKTNAKKKLRGNIIKGYKILCGEKAFLELKNSVDVQAAFKNNQCKEVIDGFGDGFSFQSCEVQHYEGFVGETDFIGEYEARFIPIVDGLYQIIPCPGVGTNHVNKRGMKTFATVKELDHNVGVEVKLQANYVVYCEVPDSIAHMNIEAPAAMSLDNGEGF